MYFKFQRSDLFCLALVLCPITAVSDCLAQGQRSSSFEPDTFYLYNENENSLYSDSKAFSAELCRSKCLADKRCRWWAYWADEDNNKEFKNRCTLNDKFNSNQKRRMPPGLIVSGRISDGSAIVGNDWESCYRDSGDTRIAACSRAIVSGKYQGNNLAALFLSRANEYRLKSDYDHVLADLDQAIHFNPNDPAAFFNRGVIYHYAKDEYDRAIADYDQAIQLDPNNAKYFSLRGEVYGYKGDYDRAVADYDQAIRLNPNDAGYYAERGVVYSNKREYESAIADYDQAIRLDPNNARYFSNRGSAYHNKHDYDRAIENYDQAIRLNPKYARAIFNRANSYRAKGDNERANADFEQANNLDPKLKRP